MKHFSLQLVSLVAGISTVWLVATALVQTITSSMFAMAGECSLELPMRRAALPGLWNGVK